MGNTANTRMGRKYGREAVRTSEHLQQIPSFTYTVPQTYHPQLTSLAVREQPQIVLDRGTLDNVLHQILTLKCLKQLELHSLRNIDTTKLQLLVNPFHSSDALKGGRAAEKEETKKPLLSLPKSGREQAGRKKGSRRIKASRTPIPRQAHSERSSASGPSQNTLSRMLRGKRVRAITPVWPLSKVLERLVLVNIEMDIKSTALLKRGLQYNTCLKTFEFWYYRFINNKVSSSSNSLSFAGFFRDVVDARNLYKLLFDLESLTKEEAFVISKMLMDKEYDRESRSSTQSLIKSLQFVDMSKSETLPTGRLLLTGIERGMNLRGVSMVSLRNDPMWQKEACLFNSKVIQTRIHSL